MRGLKRTRPRPAATGPRAANFQNTRATKHSSQPAKFNQTLFAIDENLMRAELTPTDRASYTARRKAIYEELYPETRRESTLKRGTESPSRQVGETGADRFTADTASKTGKSGKSYEPTKMLGALAALYGGGAKG